MSLRFSIELELPLEEFNVVPARPGVYLLQDRSGSTLGLFATANLRRAIKLKLAPPEVESAAPTKRINYLDVAHAVSLLTVGSAFEADWAYLQLAREHLPQTYRGLLDRWQAWFIHCDPESAFPQWVKTAHLFRPPLGEQGVYVGPFADKHAAARYIQMLEDAFDLCRYHHILVQAPRGTACAYKEMGRCPAPCDGSVSLQAYHWQVRDAVDFASTPYQTWQEEMETRMTQVAAAQDFESAARCRRLLERTAPAAKREFARLGRIEDFRYIAIMPGECKHTARVFLIAGGCVVPFADLPIDVRPFELDEIAASIAQSVQDTPLRFDEPALENIGLVCWWLFRGGPIARSFSGAIIQARDFNRTTLARALRKLGKSAPDTGNDEASIAEHEIESASPELQNPAPHLHR